MQRMIPLADVVVPYARQVAELSDARRVEARRTYSHMMALTQAVTLLYHAQRERSPDGRLVAIPADYQMAAELARDVMARAAGALPPPVQRFWERLRPRVANREWTTTEARTDEIVNKATVKRWLNVLADAGVIYVTDPGRGNMPDKWRVCPQRNQPRGSEEPEATIVPRPEDVFRSPSGG